MPTTPNKLLRYPLATDTPDVPRDMGYLGSDVDAILGTYEAAWTSYTPVLTAAITNPTIGSGSVLGAYKRLGTGKLVVVRFRINFGAGFTAGSGTYYVSLPISTLPLTAVPGNYGGNLHAVGQGSASEISTGVRPYTIHLSTVDKVIMQLNSNLGLLDHSGPVGVAWTATGYLAGTLTYEAA